MQLIKELVPQFDILNSWETILGKELAQHIKFYRLINKKHESILFIESESHYVLIAKCHIPIIREKLNQYYSPPVKTIFIKHKM